MNGQSQYAQAAISAAEGMKTRGSTSTDTSIAAVKAVTYALLDLAQAIREHEQR